MCVHYHVHKFPSNHVDVCTINGRKYISGHDFNVFKQYLLRTIVNAYVFSPLCITGVLHMYVYTLYSHL